MADLLIRAGAQDRALLERVLSGTGPRPDRVVVDAHVARLEPGLEAVSRLAGVPFIVDPQTHYLQDVQHPEDAWGQLAYADFLAWTPADFRDAARLERLAAGVVDHQLGLGATMIIPAYVHVDRAGDGWLAVQLALWQATRRHLQREGIHLPILAVAAVGWRLLDRSTWPAAVSPLGRELEDLGAAEVAVAASRVDAGARPGERLASFLAVVRRLGRERPVIAWQQGVLGEAAVAAGATGYETGLGWRERCDLRAAMGAHRRPSTGGGARPVYVELLKRGIPKSSVQELVGVPRIRAQLTCLDIQCCPYGSDDLLADARAHAIRARLRGLRAVTQPAHAAWRWKLLAQQAETGLALALRVNALARSRPRISRVDEAALRATFLVAEHRRQSLRRRPAA